MKFKQQVIVISAKKYDFTDDNGKQIKGAKLTILDETISNENTKGYGINIVSIPYDDFAKLEYVPAIYNADVSLTGKSLSLSNLEIAKKININ